jgi:hypothetical protein
MSDVQHIVRFPSDAKEEGKTVQTLCGTTWVSRPNTVEEPVCGKCFKMTLEGMHYTNAVLMQSMSTIATLHDAVSRVMAAEETGDPSIVAEEEGPVGQLAQTLMQIANMKAGRRTNLDDLFDLAAGLFTDGHSHGDGASIVEFPRNHD